MNVRSMEPQIVMKMQRVPIQVEVLIAAVFLTSLEMEKSVTVLVYT